MSKGFLLLLVLLLLAGAGDACPHSSRHRAPLRLTAAERAWLSRHASVRIALWNRHFDDDNYIAGDLGQRLAYDELRAACRRLGLAARPVSTAGAKSALELLGKEGGVDLVPGVPAVAGAGGEAALTLPSLRSPQVIVMRNSAAGISGVADLAGRTVAVVGHERMLALQRAAPQVRVWQAPDLCQALKAVSGGRADALVENLDATTYGIERCGISDLKIAAPAPLPDDLLDIAVRKDWPEVAGLIAKALGSLSAEEKEQIRHRWLTLRYEHGIQPGDLISWLAVVLGGGVVVVLALRQTIRARTAALLAEVRLRSQREQELKREKRQLDKVIESLPALFCLYDRDRFIRWNSAFQEVLGLSTEELAAGLTLSMVHEEDRELEAAKRAEIFELGEAQWEVRLLTRNGVRLHQVTGKRMELEGAAYAIATATDTTDKRLAELALHESERRFCEILENLRLIAVILDGEDRISFCNDFLLELTGRSREEVLGRNWFQVFYPNPEESSHSFHEALGGGRMCLHRDRVILTKNGTRRLISWNSTVLRNPHGDEIGAALIGEDITHRRQYENALNSIMAGVSATTGSLYLQSLVAHLARALEVDYAAISRVDVGGGVMTTVAICGDGECLENFSYPLTGTPAAWMDGTGIMIASGLSSRYPELPFFTERGFESYAGVPLKNAMGDVLGTLVVLGRNPFSNPELVEAMLNVFGVRAAAEMERARTDRALKESEQRYRLLFDKMLNGYVIGEVICDGEGKAADFRFLEVNASFETLTGYKRDGVLGRTARELLRYPQESWVGRLGNVALSEQPEQFDAYSYSLRKWLKISAYSPQPRVFAATFADITKRKFAEQALTESEEHLRQIFTQSDDGLILFEMDTFTIIEANPAALQLYGATKEEIRKVKPWALISPPDFRNLIRIIAREDAPAGFHLSRATCYRSDGSSVIVSIRGKILTLRNEYVILCSVRDITEKARIEDEMKATQARLIQANKMTSLGMLVSGVAHEINNPNNYISVNSLMLDDVWRDAAPILAEFRQRNGDFMLGGLPFSEMEVVVPRLISGITEGSSRITSIISNMKNFVRRGESGEEGVIDLNRSINSATSLLWHHIHRHTDHFRVVLAEGLPPARGNAQQIEQVIINLVINALQALPDKQSGVQVTSGIDAETGMIEISVLDEGVGMNKKVRKHLTEPFFSTKTEAGGTGLGIYISSSIVKEHNGSLSFDSAPGRGTTATVRLPVASGKGKATS